MEPYALELLIVIVFREGNVINVRMASLYLEKFAKIVLQDALKLDHLMVFVPNANKDIFNQDINAFNKKRRIIDVMFKIIMINANFANQDLMELMENAYLINK
jgi:hypothetical protein